jgi:dephospho-CoA kinase
MNKPLKIGITGGIGSGKTYVAQIFMKMGVPIYFADDRAKWLMNNNVTIVKKVHQLFGPNAYNNDSLNRAYIANKIFKNKILLEKLNSIVHPAISIDFNLWLDSQKTPYVIKEAALLIESGSYIDLDAILTIDAPLEVRIKRAAYRDKQSKKEIEKRITNQLANSTKVKVADFVINNDGYTPLLPQVIQLNTLWN